MPSARQDLLDNEIGFFVIIVPATAIPVIAMTLEIEPRWLTHAIQIEKMHTTDLWKMMQRIEVGIKGATIAEAQQ